jgi:putative RNA 2'-phosphotransferase
MTEKEITNISRFMSLVLRHQPEKIGLELDAQGWVSVAEFMEKMQKAGKNLDFALLEEVVANNNKKRFAFNEDKSRIRANQGHTVEIELGYEAQEPPEILYHGTAFKNIASILQKGILKGERHHTHLSKDIETAINVGSRHGKPVLLIVKAKRMFNEGIAFYCSENGVWLTDYVHPKYFSVQEVD